MKETEELKQEIERLKLQVEAEAEAEPEAEPEAEESEEGDDDKGNDEADAESEKLVKLNREMKDLKRALGILTKEVVKSKSVISSETNSLPLWMGSEVSQDDFGNYTAEWNYDYWSKEHPLSWRNVE